MTELGTQTEAFSDRKKELLRLLMEKRRREAEAAAATEPKIPRRQVFSPAPVSFAQQRLWFLDQLDPGNPSFNIAAAVQLRGALEVGLLQRGLDEIVRRHETLRTCFGAREGEPVQLIAEEGRVPIPLCDLQGMDDDAQRRLVDALVTRDCQRPFDLDRRPLLRTSMLRLGPQDHVLILMMHHNVGDVWSVRVLMKELVALYAAYRDGKPSPLPELPIQYADYATWQREWLQGAVLDEQVSYWSGKLEHMPEVLELPFDRPRPPLQSPWGAKHFLSVPEELKQQLRALGNRGKASLYMTVLAAWYVLLYRYTGQDDLVVGAPVANRNRSEYEGMIGFFVNSILLRTKLEGNPSFLELLERTRETTLGAFGHQDFPFERLVEILQPERAMSRNPLFQVDFVLQNAPTAVFAVEGLTMEPLPSENGTAQIDMTLDLWEAESGLGGWIEYDTDLFDPATVAQVGHHLLQLLHEVTVHPEAAIADLQLLTEADRSQLLALNRTDRPYPQGQCIHHLIEAQARRRPDAVAAVGEGAGGWQELSYGELHRRARQLARHLKTLGVGPEVPVGIFMDRSPDLLVAILGVLYAGGAYLPMDLAFPAERLEGMVEGARPPVVVTRHPLASQAPAFAGRLVLMDVELPPLDEGSGDWEGEALESPPLDGPPLDGPPLDGRVTPDSLAYTIFTSGSTGRPKGVMIPHRCLVNAYRAWEEAYELVDPPLCHLQMASFSFDVFSGDLVRGLASGGKLVLCPRETLLVPERLYALMEEEQVECAEFVPAVLRGLTAYLDESGEALEFMKVLIAGSDSWYGGEYSEVRRYIGRSTRLINSYGITETTIDTSFFESGDSRVHRDGLVPIGKPFANNRMYVLDGNLTPAPLGVPGQLYIGGAGVGRGYLGQPALTAQKFLPNPFAEVSEAPDGGDRLYATGDRARLLRDGNVEFLGRVDFQIKIRGFRIEPGEIEAQLGKLPEVASAVVLAHSAGVGDPRLVAYVVPAGAQVQAGDGDEALVEKLRSQLAETLPEYMVPAVFIVLDAFPLTDNGKINRRALPTPDASLLEQRHEYVAPRNEIEKALAEIWSDILQVERVGVFDNLFELGAHSLLLTQVVSRARAALEVEVPLRAFFETPTVAGLALTVDHLRALESAPQAPPIVRVPRSGPLPLSFTQERMWFLDQLQPGLTAYNVPGAVRMSGDLDFAALEAGFTEILRRHEIFRTTYDTRHGQPIQVIQPPRPYRLPLVDLQGLGVKAARALAERLEKRNAALPFDLQRGPVVRAVALRMAPDEHRMAMTTHHIAYDMWAREIFIFELATLYEAFSNQRPSPLEEPKIQYADYTAWQRGWLQGEVLEQQLEYWRRKLGPAPRFLDLPADRPRPPMQTYRGTRQYLQLPVAVTRELGALARRLGVTPFIVMLTAFKTLLYRYTGQHGVVVGSPIANRHRLEVEKLMGFLANTVVLYSDLGGEPTFLEAVARVRETALGAYAHQDVPFETLVQELQPERDMSRSPLFQAMFNYMQHYSAPKIDLPGLSLKLERLHSGSAQFELNVDMWEDDGYLQGVVEYCTDIVDHTTITRLVVHFKTLLESVVAAPEKTLSQLQLLPPSHLHQLRVEANHRAGGDFDLSRPFHRLFEEQAEARPEAMAVAQGVGEEMVCWSYQRLDREATALARRLAAVGVGTDTVVALLGQRGIPLLTAILAVFKAGGAYLPLDPDHPAPRVAQVLEQSGTPLVLAEAPFLPTAREARDLLPAGSAQPRLLDLGQLLEGAEPEPWPSAVRPETGETTDAWRHALGYVIFTSGSTGVPKGVMVHQEGMLNHLWANIEVLEMGPEDVLAQTASQCFDISVWQFLAPLMLGGRVHIFGDEITEDPPRLLQAVDETGVTVFETVPSLLQLMLSELGGRGALPALEALRWLLPTGEALPLKLLEEWFQVYPEIPLVNAYGPSECSDDVTLEILRRPTESAQGRVSIGRPVSGLTVHVLDRNLQEVPPGIAGEIVVGGIGVGRGYLHDPARTAGVFLPDPFSSVAGARMYRSGDLGRHRTDGALEFVGRVDFQVKVRGFRIELGEIEAVLGRHPAVQEAVVVARQDGPGGAYLVAYLVAREEHSLDPAEVKEHVGEALPAYMVPGILVQLPALPLNANGKVDRSALPAPSGDLLTGDRPYVAPRNPEETALAAIFSDLLGMERVSVEDDFFDLGGHSLLAIQALSRIRDTFQVEPPLRALFETSTVTGMVEVIQAIRWAAGGGEVDEEASLEEALVEEAPLVEEFLL